MNPKVSIIVPIYNIEDYVERCIVSLISQSYTNLEIILIDDGSNDRSRDIADHYASLEKNVFSYHKINGGLSDARNYGIAKMTGDYCMFVDGDDTIENNAILLLVNSLISNNSEISVCDMKYIYSDHEVIASGGEFVVEDFKSNRNIIFINNSACNKLFKKELFSDVIFPVGLWYEDLATIPIVISKASKVSKVDVALYNYIQRSDSIAHTINDKIFDIYKAIDHVHQYYSDNQLEDEINKLYIHHGLYLTTLRIKDSASDPIEYWNKNLIQLNHYYPEWRNNLWFSGYSIKQNIIFKLMQLKMLKIVKVLYKV